MPHAPPAHAARCAVVDLGSNSVRLVVFEGSSRNPVAIFNEKAVLRLGRGLQATGRLNEEGVVQALTVLHRYHAVARAMDAAPLTILATAAVRDAENGPEFVALLRRRMPDASTQVLSGAEEAALSADGVLGGIPSANGVLADIGGGSLELVRLEPDGPAVSHSLRLGVIRLAERSGGDPGVARGIADAALAEVPWLEQGGGRDLYLVGGAWRALARIHIARTDYPLNMVHRYTLDRQVARDLAGGIASAGRRAMERMPGAPRRRIEDLPYAAVVLRALLSATGAGRVVFSASGMREGWFMRRMPEALREQDPLLAAAHDLAARFGRDPALPAALLRWTDPLFPQEQTLGTGVLREATCWMSDIGSHDHPEFRAEQSFLRVFRDPGVGLDHHARAFLGLAVAMRYEAEVDAPFLRPARRLLDAACWHRAVVLGIALRLAYTLSAGTTRLLAGTALSLQAGRLILRLSEDAGVFAGESVLRRLDRLAQAVDAEPAVEAHRDAAA